VEIVVARIRGVVRNFFIVLADYSPHSLVPSGYERHQPLIMCDGDELEKRA